MTNELLSSKESIRLRASVASCSKLNISQIAIQIFFFTEIHPFHSLLKHSRWHVRLNLSKINNGDKQCLNLLPLIF